MDDRFLKDLREEPRPEHARSLRARLRQLEEPEGRRAFRLHPALAAVAAVMLIAAAFLLPSVRASAQQMLDLFRVRNFAVVEVDPTRLQKFKDSKIDPEALLGGDIEKVRDPGPPRMFTDLHQAAAAAGFTPRVASMIPVGFTADTDAVLGEREARITVHTQKLRDLMDALDVRDLTVPADLEGRKVTLHTQPALIQHYRSGERHVMFLQSASPELSMPAGSDLAQLGEIGLRLVGVEPQEAHRLAQNVDWHSTALIPVPMNATSFHEVTVHGQRGLLVEASPNASAPPVDGPRRNRHHGERSLLWTEQGRVYGIVGDVSQVELMQMAESVR